MRLALLLGSLAALAAVVAGCGGDESRALSKVFQGAPWVGGEELTYNLSRRGEPSFGTCVLTTEPSFEPARTRLSQLCDNADYRDESALVVDAATLQPFVTSQTASDTKKGRSTTWMNVYADAEVAFEARTNDKSTKTTRELPKPDAKSPDPGWYDDKSMLWLVRGLPLRTGFTGSYAHVLNAGQPRVLAVDVRVDSPEAVKVPAGQFSAWRVTISRGGMTHLFWVDDQAPHRVVKAKIEDVTYELAGAK